MYLGIQALLVFSVRPHFCHLDYFTCSRSALLSGFLMLRSPYTFVISDARAYISGEKISKSELDKNF